MAIPDAPDPIALFETWYAEAHATPAITEPSAMTLATADASGMPSARIVLLKGVDQRGFVFFTNTTSNKAQDLATNPQAALCFYWMPLDKQVRVQGQVEPVTDDEADAYFRTRPKQSQLGAWASKQSKPLDARLELERRLAKYTALYALTEVPRPSFWSGYRLIPQRIEFWLKQPFRLHDRVVYTRPPGVTEDASHDWERGRLFP